jgi:hypothetical protein
MHAGGQLQPDDVAAWRDDVATRLANGDENGASARMSPANCERLRLQRAA